MPVTNIKNKQKSVFLETKYVQLMKKVMNKDMCKQYQYQYYE